MKRLKLADFKSKNLKQEEQQQADQLLGQVLGDCHDSSSHSSGNDLFLRKRPGRKKFGNITLKK